MTPFDQEFLGIVLLSLQVSGLAVLVSSCVGIPLGAWLAACRDRASGR